MTMAHQMLKDPGKNLKFLIEICTIFILGIAIIYPPPGASMVSKHVELVSERDQMVHRTVKNDEKLRLCLFLRKSF